MTGSARSAGRFSRGTMLSQRRLLQTYIYSLAVHIERLIEKDLYTYSYRQFLSRYSFFNSEGGSGGGGCGRDRRVGGAIADSGFHEGLRYLLRCLFWGPF